MNNIKHILRFEELAMPLWQITAICFVEAQRQIKDPRFDVAFRRLGVVDQ